MGRFYLLGLLTTLNCLLVLDKIVLSILIEPIRAEFGLSDTQLGALMGLVYAVFMGTAGLPMGMLADRMSRKLLASICLAAWSAMTLVTAAAQNLWHLIACRIGVGIGEAGGGPASISMLADAFDSRRRATAMSIFATGTQLAALLNLTVVTQVSHVLGWRMALVVTAVPGFVVAALLHWTTREPVRAGTERRSPIPEPLPLRAALGRIWEQRSLRHLLAATALCYIVVAGMGSWHFSFLVRIHSLSLHEIGPILGIGMALMGVVSNVGAGVLSDRLGAHDERWRTRALSIGAAMIAAIGYGSLLTPVPRMAVALVILFGASVVFWFPTVASLSQDLVEPRLRSTVAGVLFLLANLVGYGLGPLLVGALSDLFAARQGEEALRYALVIVLSLLVWASLHFLRAGRCLRADLQRVRAGSEAR